MSNTFTSASSNASASGNREINVFSSSSSSMVRPQLNSTNEAYFWPIQYKLYQEYHSLFVDLQSRINQQYTDNYMNNIPNNLLTLTSNRLAILREQSFRYRACMKRASQLINTHPGLDEILRTDARNAKQEEENYFDIAQLTDQSFNITSAIWHMTDVAFLHSHNSVTTSSSSSSSMSSSSSSSSSSLVIALLQCIRENFIHTVDESMYLRIVVPLRSTAAVLVPRIQIEVWDLVAKLVIEGQPRDGGKLLNEMGQSIRDKDVLSLASLLQEYPVLTSSGTDMSGNYIAHWDSWKAKAVTARRNYCNDSKRLRLINTNNPQEYHIYKVQQAIYDILAGDSWGNTNQPQGLRALPVDPQSIVFELSPEDKERIVNDKQFAQEIQQQTIQPYADWSHLFICTLLYGDVAPTTLGHSTLATTLRECMEVDGVQMVNIDDIEDVEERIRQGVGIEGYNHQEQRTHLLLSTLTKILERDAIAPLRLLYYFKDHAAAAHIADILWHAGQLDTVPVLMNDPLNLSNKIVAPRAHFILSYAKQLLDYDARLARVAVSYASIVSLDTVLASTGVPLSILQTLANERTDSSLSLATMLLGIESSSLNGQLKRVKLALMTGSAPEAVTTAMLDKALTSIPLINDIDVTNAMALAQRVNRYETARAIGYKWIHTLLERGIDFYGTALLWSIRLSMVNEIDTIAKKLLDHMYRALETYVLRGDPEGEQQAWREENLSEETEIDDNNNHHHYNDTIRSSSANKSYDPLSDLYKFTNVCEPQSFYVLFKRWGKVQEALLPVDQTLSCVGHSTVVSEENETYSHNSCTDSVILRTFLSTAYDGTGGVLSNSIPNHNGTFTKVCSVVLHRCLLVRRILGEFMGVVNEIYYSVSSSSSNYHHRRNIPRNLGSLNDKKWIVHDRAADLYRAAGADIATLCHSELDTDLVTSNTLANEYTDDQIGNEMNTVVDNNGITNNNNNENFGNNRNFVVVASSSRTSTAPLPDIILILQTAAVSGLFDAAEVPPETRTDQVENNLYLVPPIEYVDIRCLIDRLEECIAVPGLDDDDYVKGTKIVKEKGISNDIASSLRIRLLYSLARSTFPVKS